MDEVDAGDPNFYDINKKKLCYIINNEEFLSKLNYQKRTGTDVDYMNLKKTFESLKFKIISHKNCTAKEICDNLKAVTERKNLSNYCMFVCIILSHGNEDSIYGTDGPVKLERLLNLFNGNNCRALIGKPKIFFIQACRGNRVDRGVMADDLILNNIDRVPIEADFLIGYSTVPGYLSWRNEDKGSWYIQTLCDELKKSAKSEDILQILLNVNETVARNFRTVTDDSRYGCVEIPTFICMLRKFIRFIKQ